MAGPGVLTVTFEVVPEGKEMINRWYLEEHIEDRLAIDGFQGVRRYWSLAAPLRHMAVWDVDDAGWPFQPAYRAIPHDAWSDRIGHLRGPSMRRGWEQVSASGFRSPHPDDVRPGCRGIRLVEMDIPSEHEDEFNRWYEQEHIPDMLGRPEYLGIRRFRTIEGPPEQATYLAIWALSDVELHSRPDYVVPPPTEWTRRIASLRTRSERESWAEIDDGHEA